jgi:hypothetical protein
VGQIEKEPARAGLVGCRAVARVPGTHLIANPLPPARAVFVAKHRRLA